MAAVGQGQRTGTNPARKQNCIGFFVPFLLQMEKREKNRNIQALSDSQVEGLSKATDKKFGIATYFAAQGMSSCYLLHFSCSTSPEVSKLFVFPADSASKTVYVASTES